MAFLNIFHMSKLNCKQVSSLEKMNSFSFQTKVLSSLSLPLTYEVMCKQVPLVHRLMKEGLLGLGDYHANFGVNIRRVEIS